MARVCSLMCVVILAAQALTAPKLKDTSPKEPPIIGDWVRVGHLQAGAIVAPDNQTHHQIFKADGVWEYYYGDRAGSTRAQFDSDFRKNPFTVDIHTNRDQSTGWTGIYKVEGDKLTLCLVIKGNDRPKTFESSADHPTTIWEFKRVRSKDE